MQKIWILGSSNIDMNYYLEELPLKGQTIHAENYTSATGGKGANQAWAASHWETEEGFIGAVGNDSSGEILQKRLADKGIDTTHISVVENSPSGSAVIYVDKNGNNCIVVHGGANLRIPLDAVMTIPYSVGDILLSQLEVNMDAVEAAFSKAHSSGVTTVLNPSPIRNLPDTLCENTDILVLNQHEAEQLSGSPVGNREEALLASTKMIARGIRTIVVTLGEDGVVLAEEDSHHFAEGVSVVPRDTQGAGDAFLGTLVAQISLGLQIQQAAEFANKVAAFTVTQLGSTQVSMPPANAPFLRELSRT